MTISLVQSGKNRPVVRHQARHAAFVAVLLGLACVALCHLARADSGYQPTASPGDRAQMENLKRGADQGSSKAEFELSKAYMQGRVFKQDIGEAVKWVRAAAEQGLPEAEANLAFLYLEGPGVPRDDSQAFHWMEKAAEQGDPKAEYNLGLMYGLGQGVKKDITEGVHWYIKAAEHGYSLAAYYVGVAYLQGIGVTQDQVKGYMWCYLGASRFGYPPSQKMLETLNTKMDKAKIAQGRAKAAEWIRTHPNINAVPL